jgi:heterodisulfide reductase subunit B
MPKKECEECKRCLPCPVTSGDPSEGAYPIAQETGDVWYCTSCFYCEDVCPIESPREQAISHRREEQRHSERMLGPLSSLRAHGSLFELKQLHQTLRKEWGLPKLPRPDVTKLNVLFSLLLDRCAEKKTAPTTIGASNKQSSQTASKKRTAFNAETALFLGCLIPYRIPEYERSAREILQKLAIKTVDLPFACCGSIMTESYSEELWLTIAAYNLALAEQTGISTVISLCGGCTGNLRRVNKILTKNNKKLSKVNSLLKQIGMTYEGSITVLHISEFLQQKKMKKKLAKQLLKERKEKLSSLQIAVQIPCQVIRPQETSPLGHLEEKLLTDLLKATTVDIVAYPFETLCCGSTILQYNESLAYAIAKKRLEALVKRKVDALVLGCGNCSMNFTIHQGQYSDAKLATFFFTEILAYALGEKNNRLDSLIEQKKEL